MTANIAISQTPDDWEWARLSELTSGIFDCPHSTPKLAETGPYLARTQDVGTGIFRPETAARVSMETYRERIARAEPTSGDLLYSREGTYFGIAAEVPDKTLVCLGQRMVLIRPDARMVNHRYLRYWLNSARMAAYVEAHKDGSVAQRLNLPIIRDIPVPVPPIGVQQGIAAMLGELDEKIESNRRQLRLLDDLIQANWAKASGEALQLRRLGDVVSTQYGLTASAEAGGLGPKFLRVTDINKENWVSWTSVPSVVIDEADWKKYQLSKGDLLVARMADPGKSAIYDDESIDAVFASYLVRLQAPTYDEALYVYGFLKSSLYAEYATAATTGSVQKNMNAKVIVDVNLPWPEKDSMEAFASIASPLRAEINQRVRENARLAGIRDTLQPELFSGRISVPEADEAA